MICPEIFYWWSKGENFEVIFTHTWSLCCCHFGLQQPQWLQDSWNETTNSLCFYHSSYIECNCHRIFHNVV